VWHKLMLLFCLTAAVSGTPLRQAEAADDFARAFAQLGQGHLEATDGGVGDDADVGVLKAGSHTPALRGMVPLPTAPAFLTPHLSDCLSATGFRNRNTLERAGTLSRYFTQRHVWLQCFLF
jgi:hypothetical protein